MADLPPPIASSAAQTFVQSRQIATERDQRRAEQITAAQRQTKAIDEADVTVDTNDADERVYTDSEGAGSSGRFLENADQPTPQPEDDASNTTDENGIQRSSDGTIHLDLQA